jgi:hypothetical protein
MIASSDLERRNDKRGKCLFPEPKTRCMWMWLTCLPPPRLAVIRGKGTGEDEKRKELVLKSGDPAETGSRIVSSQV